MLFTAGVDEAGRGSLCGPVVAAAVVLDPDKPMPGLNDSKLLTPKQRQRLCEQITENAIGWSIRRSEHDEIDKHNILQATMLAMKRAICSLPLKPGLVIADGTTVPDVDVPVRPEIRGDRRYPEIAAASIIAKVERDREMIELNSHYPGYGFAAHKGYGTKAHMEALRTLGATPIHRRSFKPVSEMR